jgi:hypothetical protein
MTDGRLEAVFTLPLRGLTLTAPVDHESDDGVRVQLTADAGGFRLQIRIDGLNEQQALLRARSMADVLYERLLLEFAPSIEESMPPVHEHSVFTGQETATRHTLHAASGHIAISGETVSLILGVGPNRIVPVVERALLDTRPGTPAVTGALETSRRMFRVAMETTDPVASYLTCYSALALFALYKLGARRGRGQAALDSILLAEDQTIIQVNLTRADGRRVAETSYTAARNDFVHAEDRGADPAAAAQALASRLGPFKRLAATILNKG